MYKAEEEQRRKGDGQREKKQKAGGRRFNLSDYVKDEPSGQPLADFMEVG